MTDRNRLAANTNESVADDTKDHGDRTRLAANTNESVASDED